VVSNWFIFGAVVWIPIACLIYAAFDKIISRVENIWLRGLYCVLCSAVLSPGLFWSHSPIPSPGGVAYLLHVRQALGYAHDPANLINLSLWLFTAVLFFVINVFRRVLPSRKGTTPNSKRHPDAREASQVSPSSEPRAGGRER